MLEFSEFVRDRAPALARYAGVLTADRHLAQDLVQEALERAHRRWAHIGALDRPDLYVRRILTNAYISWYRRLSSRMSHPVADPGELADSGGPLVPDPAEAITERHAVRVMIDRLPRRQRAVIVLRYYERLTNEEIAAVLGCSAGTVRAHLSRALTSLRRNADARISSEYGSEAVA